MKLQQLKGIDPRWMLYGAAIAGVLYLAWQIKRAASSAADTAGAVAAGAVEVARDVGTAVNPADSRNLVNRGVESVGQALTNDDSWSLGGWIYDKTHADPFKLQARPASLTPETPQAQPGWWPF